jgi:hypothetical protein
MGREEKVSQIQVVVKEDAGCARLAAEGSSGTTAARRFL